MKNNYTVAVYDTEHYTKYELREMYQAIIERATGHRAAAMGYGDGILLDLLATPEQVIEIEAELAELD